MSDAPTEKKIPVMLGLVDLSNVLGLQVALAVEEIAGLEIKRDYFEETVTARPHVSADLLERAARELAEAAANLRAWCDANPELPDAD